MRRNAQWIFFQRCLVAYIPDNICSLVWWLFGWVWNRDGVFINSRILFESLKLFFHFPQFAEQSLNVKLFNENTDPKTWISMIPTSAHTGDGMGNLMAYIVNLCQSILAKKLLYSEKLQCTVLEVSTVAIRYVWQCQLSVWRNNVCVCVVGAHVMLLCWATNRASNLSVQLLHVICWVMLCVTCWVMLCVTCWVMLHQVKVIQGLGTTIDVLLTNGRLRYGDTIVLPGSEGPIVTNVKGLLMPQPLRELRVKVGS